MVLMEKLQALADIHLGPVQLGNIFSALLALVVCLAAGRFIRAALHRVMDRAKKLDPTLRGFVQSAVRILLWVLTAIIVADALGLSTSSLVAVVSVIGLALSLSIQNVMANVFSGITLLVTKPFEAGDYVDISGKVGTVKRVGLFYTVLDTFENMRVSVPNADVTAAAVVNYSAEEVRRLDLTYSASYDAPTETVRAALLEALEASTFCTPSAIGGFPQVAGIDFTVNVAIPFAAGEMYPGTTYAAPASINRVTINSINGKDFDLEATYAVVTNDFVAAGGDTYYALSTSEKITDTGVPLDECVMMYITEVLGGVKPAGRITINDPLTAFNDVNTEAWYVPAVRLVAFNGIMKGTAEGVFAPEEAVSEASVYNTIYNMEKNNAANEGKELPTTGNTEVWYADAVKWAMDNKLVDEFDQDGPMLRNDVLTFMTKYAEMKGVDGSKLMIGDENGDLMLDKTLTRAQWAQVIYNFMMAPAAKAAE